MRGSRCWIDANDWTMTENFSLWNPALYGLCLCPARISGLPVCLHTYLYMYIESLCSGDSDLNVAKEKSQSGRARLRLLVATSWSLFSFALLPLAIHVSIFIHLYILIYMSLYVHIDILKRCDNHARILITLNLLFDRYISLAYQDTCFDRKKLPPVSICHSFHQRTIIARLLFQKSKKTRGNL